LIPYVLTYFLPFFAGLCAVRCLVWDAPSFQPAGHSGTCLPSFLTRLPACLPAFV
jgi:hypothetical protein